MQVDHRDRTTLIDVRLPHKRRKSGHFLTAAWCQEATYALQQIAAYSITSSARASNVGGTSMPSVLAVLRLIASLTKLVRLVNSIRDKAAI
jgi:hypothetical protein